MPDEPENLQHPTEDIVTAAVAAVRAVSRQYFAAMPAAWQGELVAQYLGKLFNANPAARRGFALALGALAPAGKRCFAAALLRLCCGFAAALLRLHCCLLLESPVILCASEDDQDADVYADLCGRVLTYADVC
jgi:hypothetical protein